MSIRIEDLDPDFQRMLRDQGIKEPRKHTFGIEEKSRYAIKVLAVVANLTQDQRKRVLQHALTMNTPPRSKS